ncbi:MAG: hypothetical protein ACK56I_02635, partial [bacterium]
MPSRRKPENTSADQPCDHQWRKQPRCQPAPPPKTPCPTQPLCHHSANTLQEQLARVGMIRTARWLPETLDGSNIKFHLDARTHSIRAAASNSGKARVYGIFDLLFLAAGTKEPPQQRSQP